MANTEGLSDEAVESMFSGPVPSPGEDRRRRMIQKRLELPMGTKPAAKVVRRSPQSQSQPQENSSSTTSLNDNHPGARGEKKYRGSESTQTKDNLGPTPVLGSIVERSRRSRRNKGNRKPIVPSSEKRTGFPSLNAPIGTYVGATKHTQRQIKSTPPQSNDSIPPASTDKHNTNNVNDKNRNFDQLHRETVQDADRMLSQMSATEIDESRRELEQALSPEMIQFLRQRYQQKGGKSSKQTKIAKQSTPSSSESLPRFTPSVPAAEEDENTGPAKNSQSEVDEALEKAKAKFEQIASIQSYDELDLVYRKENDGEEGLFYFDKKEKGEEQEDDTIQLACDLLRSSVPRQNLWAARTIRIILQRDLKLHLESRIDGQAFAEGQVRKYPVTLPISLRCLLDAPASQRSNNGYSLHTYVLECIYLLLRMSVMPDHDVDIAGSLSDKAPTLHVMYQSWFADDAVPSIPIDQCYQKSNKVKPIEVQGTKNAAYAAGSSSESALEDGESFLKDPLWTLLSKMKMIPRLAELLQKAKICKGKGTNSIMQLPDEAIAVICGILAMMCHRSPGAASAIAQHESLTKDLLAFALEENRDQSSLVLGKSTFLPVVILFSILARQSSVAAQALEEPHAEDLMLKALAIKPKDGIGDECQRWCLIFWRTLLRYGYGLNFLDLVLTITASQVAVNLTHWECRIEFFSCLSAARLSFPDIAVERLLSAVVGAIDCVELLAKNLQSKNKPTAHDILGAAACLDFIASCEATEGKRSLWLQIQDKESSRLNESLSLFLSTDFIALHITNGALRGFLTTEEAFDYRQAQLDAAQCKLLLSLLSIHSKLQPGDWQESIMDMLFVQAKQEGKRQPPVNRKHHFPGMHLQSSWRNRCHSKVLTAMIREVKDGKKFEFSILLGLGFALVGRFNEGEEALADELLRELCWLEPQTASSSGIQILASMLLRNLRATKDSRAQLDHSSALLGYTSATPSKPTALKTVLSGPSMKSSELLLPVGSNWLWKVLAGSTEGSDEVSRDFLEVLRAACNAIRYLESKASDEVCQYANHVSNGVKMYYIMNICLHGERLWEQEDIIDFADSLLVRYSLNLDVTAGALFVKECVLHAGRAKMEPDETLTEEEEKVKKWLLEEPIEGLKDVIGFLGDICKSYTEFGMQYGKFFARCVRTFLLPAFPVKVRCDVCRRMEGLLHLLTLEDDEEELVSNITPYIFLPVDGLDVSQDDPLWLDMLADIFPVGHVRRPDMRFIETLSVCVLARSLVRSMQNKQSPFLLKLAKTRLDRTDNFFAISVLEVATIMTKQKQSMWIRSAINICGKVPIEETSGLREMGWENLLSTTTGATPQSP